MNLNDPRWDAEERAASGMDEERLIETALDCGAAAAAIVEQENIVLNPAFRAMCEEDRCGLFGRCYMCPPDIGPIEELMAQVRSYEKGLLYQTVRPLEDSFDIDGMRSAKELHTQVSQRVLDALRPVLGKAALHLTCGGCGLCSQCAKQMNLPCFHRSRALPSLESYGIDVYNTTRSTALQYVNGPNTVTYFGFVLFSDKDNG